MTTQTEITQRNHHRAVRFFWCFLIGATAVSLIGNITHAVLPYIPRIVIQIGAAAVPPIALLAAVHGIALAVHAGASGTVYRWAVSAVAAIGAGAFALSFLALRDLMRVIGYSSAIGWMFPAIIDTAVAVSTMMLVALGDKPARRPRTVTTSANTTTSARAHPVQAKRVQPSASIQPRPAQTLQASAQTEGSQGDAEIAEVDADLASELIASGVTTQPAETVIAVLEAHRNGASINAAAKTSGINYRTAQRIVEATLEHRHRQLMMVG
jgi:hypothetical protein